MTPAAVVLVGGPEEYLGIRAMDRVRSQVRAAEPDVEISRLHAGTYEPGSLAMVVSPSLFGESKLIEVEAVEAMNDSFLADALAYLAHPEPDAVLVLRHGGGVRGKKLLDAIKAGGWPVVDCQPLKKDADKTAFVTAEFRAASRKISGDAVQSLVNAVGANLAELAAACNQLIADASGAVTPELVDRYYGGRIEATAFKVADAGEHSAAIEKEADEFAAAFLTPASSMDAVLPQRLDLAALERLARTWGVSPHSLVRRMVERGRTTESSARRAYQRLAMIYDPSADPTSAYPGEVPTLLKKATELAADHGSGVPAFAELLKISPRPVRDLLGEADQRPVLRLVVDD